MRLRKRWCRTGNGGFATGHFQLCIEGPGAEVEIGCRMTPDTARADEGSSNACANGIPMQMGRFCLCNPRNLDPVWQKCLLTRLAKACRADDVIELFYSYLVEIPRISTTFPAIVDARHLQELEARMLT